MGRLEEIEAAVILAEAAEVGVTMTAGEARALVDVAKAVLKLNEEERCCVLCRGWSKHFEDCPLDALEG